MDSNKGLRMSRLPLPVRLVFVSAAFLLHVGCVHTEYEIHLRPDGESIQRTLTVSGAVTSSGGEKTSPLDAQELARLHSIYDPADDKIEDNRHTFTGRFQDAMPADIGGAGSYTHFDSPLGSTSYYSERFRGEDDLVRSMQYREDAVDKIITLLSHWASSEISDRALSKRVETFLDQELRRDLKNIALYCWTHAMLSDLDEQKTLQRLAARLLQYGVERDYVSMSDVPQMLRILNSTEEQDKLELLREILLKKLECDDPDALAILTDQERFAASLRESIRKTDIYREALAEHNREKKGGDENSETNGDEEKGGDGQPTVGEPFDPNGLLTTYALQATLPKMAGNRVSVNVTIHCDEPPYLTNTIWDEEQQAATWKASIDGVNVPAMVFAGWSVPNERTQTERFGGVVVTGETLAEFVVWYQGLDTDEKEQWGVFLNGLQPESDLIARVEAFRFQNEQDDGLAERMKSVLRNPLKNQLSE